MGNQNTKQTTSTIFQGMKYSALDPLETNYEQAITVLTPFQSLKNLPVPFSEPQCVLHKHEILICGGYKKSDCYSYHTIKNKYKYICDYPQSIFLNGHCVMKLVDNSSYENNNEITLLSLGRYCEHTLVMKYISVWNDDNGDNNDNNDNNDNDIKKFKKPNNYNQWVSLVSNDNHIIRITRHEDDYQGMRAVIGGSNSHLLFITYRQNNISVYNLKTFKFIKRDILPIDDVIWYHCFVSKSENGQEENNIEKKGRKNEMLLFCKKIGLSIKYDEDNNTFQFRQLSVCEDIEIFNYYAYVHINNAILFFGGHCREGNKYVTSKAIHKYLIQENSWITFEYTLPIPLYKCFGILNEDNTCIHIIGGSDDKENTVPIHVKTNVNEWIASHLVRLLAAFQTIFFFNAYNKFIKMSSTKKSTVKTRSQNHLSTLDSNFRDKIRMD
ncbi:hypothetical protein RFI_29895 [Reticulomyxa filosa]|uniref:Kelch motif family protein n=1 Tax=Reticulomyxa filosa TaxID=46433 RepID=X6M264_RETFI|nr:hypothetical protein RFI_29895 [Reticulomyxa filosa]|eukprot:ETO07497.1 hypothetical protein RFI_29895 [Reticulomyxa filosa]